MIKKIIITAVISIMSTIGVQYIFIKKASPLAIIEILRTIRGFEKEQDKTKPKDVVQEKNRL